MSWHVDTEDVAAYALGELDPARSFSLEAHALACAECREEIAQYAPVHRLERVWAEIGEAVDAPAPAPVERALLRVGVPDHLARLLAATPSLTLSWLASVAGALVFGVVAAHLGEHGLLLFLTVAPLLPLAGVAAAYGPGVDPTHEIGLASPMRSFRLLLVRATAVLATTTVVAAVAAFALPGFEWTVAAWLLPALGLTTGSLALATFVAPLTASGIVAFVWIAAVGLTATFGSDRLVAFGSVGQAIFVAVTFLGAVVVASRRDAFEAERRP